MCKNELIVNTSFKPINLGYKTEHIKHSLYYIAQNGEVVTLLSDIPLYGVINYASIEPIKNEHNVLNGYKIIIGRS